MRGLPPAQTEGLRTFRERFLTVPLNLPSPFFGLVLSKIAIAIHSQRTKHSLLLIGDVAFGFVLQHSQQIDARLRLCKVEEHLPFIVWK